MLSQPYLKRFYDNGCQLGPKVGGKGDVHRFKDDDQNFILKIVKIA
jgi:hypothetical protein